MRTTIRLNDELLRKAKMRAVNEGRSMTSLVEEGLAIILGKPRPSNRKRIELPVSNATGGVMPGVDLNRSSDLEEVMKTL